MRGVHHAVRRAFTEALERRTAAAPADLRAGCAFVDA